MHRSLSEAEQKGGPVWASRMNRRTRSSRPAWLVFTDITGNMEGFGPGFWQMVAKEPTIWPVRMTGLRCLS